MPEFSSFSTGRRLNWKLARQVLNYGPVAKTTERLPTERLLNEEVSIMADMKDRIKSGIDAAADRAKSATERFGEAGNQAKQEGPGVVDRVKDNAQQFVDRASELGGQARDKVSEWAGDAGTAARQAGQRVQNWADDAYESGAERLSDFGNEVTSLIRNHPIPSVLIGLGIGILLGRSAKML